MLQDFQTAGSLLTYHHRILRDRARLRAFHDAIDASVKPGDVVLDIGTGTGILAFFACKAGAKRVYAVEEGPAMEIAKGLADHNGLSDRIVFIHGRSTEIDLPEPVDVIVTETLWCFGIGEGVVSWVSDARNRFLRDGGRIVPEWVEPIVVPLAAREIGAHARVDAKLLSGLDFTPLETLLGNAVHQVMLQESMFLGDPVPLCRIELATADGPDVTAEAELVCRREAVLYGVGGWFESGLAPGVLLSNRPGTNGATSWQHAFFPLDPPQDVTEGTKMVWRVATASDDGVLTWSALIDRVPDRVAHSTFFAVPLSVVADGGHTP
jgi:protein arginine N-methyltransferase 1